MTNRDKVLSMLINNLGEFVSGEKMSDTLQISRAGIWKHIKKLRQQGYDISAVTNKGYMLADIPNTLSAGILSDNTNIIGRNVEYFDTIDSTNKKARQLADDGACEGTVVIANQQTMGRGRMQRAWISPPDNGLWLSIILRPEIDPADASKLTMLASLAVANTLKKYLPVELKWPNDVMVNNKKLCGILVEASSEPGFLNYAVVGIGINANNTEEDFLDELKKIATSIYIESGKKVERVFLAKELFTEFDRLYTEFLETKSFDSVIEETKKLSNTIGKRILVVGIMGSFFGEAIDYDNDGALLVRKDDNTIEKVLSADVSIRQNH